MYLRRGLDLCFAVDHRRDTGSSGLAKLIAPKTTMQVISEKWKAGSKLEALCFNPPILWIRCYQASDANSFVSGTRHLDARLSMMVFYDQTRNQSGLVLLSRRSSGCREGPRRELREQRGSEVWSLRLVQVEWPVVC
jgi:hypothetical protein